jgi:hypothetical protein
MNAEQWISKPRRYGAPGFAEEVHFKTICEVSVDGQ